MASSTAGRCCFVIFNSSHAYNIQRVRCVVRRCHFPCAGTLASEEVAFQIVAKKICPSTRLPWDEPIAESLVGLPPRLEFPGRGGRVGGGRKRPPSPTSADVDNDRRSGYSRLSDSETDFSEWSVDKLREFLAVSARKECNNRPASVRFFAGPARMHAHRLRLYAGSFTYILLH